MFLLAKSGRPSSEAWLTLQHCRLQDSFISEDMDGEELGDGTKSQAVGGGGGIPLA